MATGSELNTLTDGSNADALHTHNFTNITYHNELEGLQGGDPSADDFYHLSEDLFNKFINLDDYYLKLDGNNANTTINIGSQDLITTGTISYSEADWTGGNVIYVPLTGNIQTYINNATAGDTLILASGEYLITSTITVNKQINIMGQGNAGFYTIPSAAGHGTLIKSTTAAIIGFNIASSNVRIAHLSINLTGNASTGINTDNNLTGLVLTNIDVLITCNGLAQGFTVYGSNIVMRNLTFYITSNNTASSGFWFWNDLNTTQDAIADCYNVTGTVKGGGSFAYAFVCENIDDTNKLTLNLHHCDAVALTGTPLDIAIASISTTTNNSTVNCYLCTLNGADYDAYQTGSNVLALGGSVLENKTVSGTVTYRAAMATGIGVFGGTLTIAAGSITDTTGTISFDNNNFITSGNISINSNSSKLFLGENNEGSIYYNGNDLIISVGENPSLDSLIKLNDDVIIDGILNVGNGSIYEEFDSPDELSWKGNNGQLVKIIDKTGIDLFKVFNDNGTAVLTVFNDGSLSSNNFISTIGNGTEPYAATSTTLNNNLNADLLDNQHGTYYIAMAIAL